MIAATEGAEFQFIGEIPADWEIVRVRRITQEHKQGYYTEQPYVEEGVKLVRITDIDDLANVSFENMPFVAISSKEEQDFKVQNNDFLFARSGTIGRFGLVKSPERSVFASYLIRFRFKGADSEFLRFVFSSYFFKEGLISTLHGGANKNIHAENIKEQFIAIPPLELQVKIASFLDCKTTAIDILIAKKQRLIQLLEEKRTALINQAVTKGLNPNTPMKDSGIPWLGEIPEHWEICSVKRLAQILRGKFSHRPRNDPKFYGGSYPFIQTGDISRAGRWITEYSQTLNEAGYAISKEFPAGTVVMIITGAKTGEVAILGFDACFPDSAIGFVPYRTKVTSDFLYYMFSVLKPGLDSTVIISTQENLNVERIGSLPTVCPPLDEQQNIVHFLDVQSAQLGKIQTQIEKQLDKLLEYRQSLITAAVTGQLNIGEEDAA